MAPEGNRNEGQTLSRTSRGPPDVGKLSPGCLYPPLASKGGGGGGGGMGARRRGWTGGGGCAGRSTGPQGRGAPRGAPTERCPVPRRRTAGRSCSRTTVGNFSDSSGMIHLWGQKQTLIHH